MRAGMAALDVLEEEELGVRALRLGATLRERLRTRLAPYSMIKDVRGPGCSPASSSSRRASSA
jgi:4-aminobutyrate aminotransferase-like enzyme